MKTRDIATTVAAIGFTLLIFGLVATAKFFFIRIAAGCP